METIRKGTRTRIIFRIEPVACSFTAVRWTKLEDWVLGLKTWIDAYVNTEPVCIKWKMYTHEYLINVNLLSLFTCFSVIYIFIDICLGDSVLQCECKKAMPVFMCCMCRENWLLSTIIMCNYFVVELQFIIILRTWSKY